MIKKRFLTSDWEAAQCRAFHLEPIGEIKCKHRESCSLVYALQLERTSCHKCRVASTLLLRVCLLAPRSASIHFKAFDSC